MRIAVLTPAAVPLVTGGFERLWQGIVDHIAAETEHRAELISFPSPESTLPEVMATYREVASRDLDDYDLLLTSKYPAWMVRHRNHVVYMAHKLRGLYDTYPADWPVECAHPMAEQLRRRVATLLVRDQLDEIFTGFDEVLAALGPDHPELAHPSPLGRALVHALDRIALAPGAIRRYLAISDTVARRRDYFPPGADVGVILPPTTVPPRVRDRRDYFFTASRLDRPKRIDLLIEAMAHVPTDTRLVIAGDGPERGRLEAMAAADPRIELVGRVDEDELARLYEGAVAVPFVPADEDYGLIALEAMEGGTPVITCTDSGGPTELVDHGASGLVVEPTPEALGAAIDAFARCPELADDFGSVAAASVTHITWDAVLAGLLDTAPPSRPVAPPRRRVLRTCDDRPRALVLNTFTAHDPRGGGQLRAFHLSRALTSHFDVAMLSLDEAGRDGWTRDDHPHLVETAVPRSLDQGRIEVEQSHRVGIPVSDIFGGTSVVHTPAYVRELRRRLARADVVMLAHPYMYPALEIAGVPVPPIVYDAYNVESVLKDAMLPRDAAGDEMRRIVHDLEEATLAAADLVSVCSDEDATIFAEHYRWIPPVQLAPNGADLSRIRASLGDERVARRRRWLRAMGADPDTRVALFLGSWHQPNIDAAAFLHEIAADLPEVLFVMVGSHTHALAGAELTQNVVQLGVVTDATKRLLLGCADVGVNPMDAGSGTNLKLVEYLGSGLATVTTPIGARGLPDSDPPLCTIAALPDFADAIVAELARDPSSDEVVARARRARRLVEEAYDWRVIGEALAARMTELI